jgi:hypothetical protein
MANLDLLEPKDARTSNAIQQHPYHVPAAQGARRQGRQGCATCLPARPSAELLASLFGWLVWLACNTSFAGMLRAAILIGITLNPLVEKIRS